MSFLDELRQVVQVAERQRQVGRASHRPKQPPASRRGPARAMPSRPLRSTPATPATSKSRPSRFRRRSTAWRNPAQARGWHCPGWHWLRQWLVHVPILRSPTVEWHWLGQWHVRVARRSLSRLREAAGTRRDRRRLRWPWLCQWREGWPWLRQWCRDGEAAE